MTDRRRSRIVRPFALAATAAVLCGAVGLAGADKQTFRARVIKPDFPNNITVKLDLSEFSTPDEIAALRSALDEGEKAFLKTFRKKAKGSLMFYGIEQPSIKFYAAFEAPTEKGRAIALFAENRTVLSGPGQAYSGLLFLVATLEVDAQGNGEGRLYENAYIKFTPDGRLDIESYRTVPAQLIQVRLAK
jgi:hypothetical protein